MAGLFDIVLRCEACGRVEPETRPAARLRLTDGSWVAIEDDAPAFWRRQPITLERALQEGRVQSRDLWSCDACGQIQGTWRVVMPSRATPRHLRARLVLAVIMMVLLLVQGWSRMHWPSAVIVQHALLALVLILAGVMAVSLLRDQRTRQSFRRRFGPIDATKPARCERCGAASGRSRLLLEQKLNSRKIRAARCSACGERGLRSVDGGVEVHA